MDETSRHTALARIRKKSGLTQLQIADSLGVSKATYSAWETGRAKLGEDRIVALCDLFGCKCIFSCCLYYFFHILYTSIALLFIKILPTH